MSSWIGGSISNLTGQLSNLTKDILSEGTEETSDVGTELTLANEKIGEQDSIISTQRSEIRQLKTLNKELEEKAESSELQINSISREYRSVLENKEKEVNDLKKQTSELLEQHARAAALSTSSKDESSTSSYQGQGRYGNDEFSTSGDYKLASDDWHADEWHFDDNLRLQQETNVLRTNLQRSQAEVKHWKSVAGQLGKNADDSSTKLPASADVLDLQHKVKDLEAEISKKGELLQQQAASLHDHHRHKLSALKERHAKEISKLQEKVSTLEQQLEDGNVTPPSSGPSTLPESDRESIATRQTELEEKLQAAVKEKNKAVNSRSHLEGMLEELQQELERLQFVEEQHQQRSLDADTWQKKIEELYRVLEKSETENKRLKNDLQNVQSDMKNETSLALLSSKEKHDGAVADLSEIIENIGDSSVQQKTSDIFNILEKENLSLKEEKLKLEEQVILLQKMVSTSNIEEAMVGETVSQLSTGPPSSHDGDTEYDSSQASESSLSMPKSALQISKEEVEEELNKLRKHYEELRNDSSNFEMEKADWMMEKEALEDVLTDLRSQSEGQEEIITHLKSLHSSGTPSVSSAIQDEEPDKEEESQKVAALESEIQAMRDDNKELEKALEELDSQHSEALAQLIGQRNKMADDIQDKDVLVKQYQNEIESLKATIDELKETSYSVGDDKEELEQKISAYEQELSELRGNDKKLIMLETELSELNQKLQKGGHVINDLHMDKQELEGELKKAKEELHTLKMNANEARQEKKELEAKEKEMQEQLLEMEEEVEKWQQRNEDRQVGMAEAGNMEKEECRQLRTQVQSMEKEREVLKEEFQHLIHDTKPHSDLAVTLGDSPFRGMFEEEMKVRERLEKDENVIEELRGHVEKLQSRKNELKEQVSHLEQDLVDSNSLVKFVRKEKSDVEKTLTELTSDCQIKIDLISELEREVIDLKQKSADMEGHNDHLETNHEKDIMTEKLIELTTNLEAYEEEFVQIQARLGEYKQMCQDKDVDIDMLKSKIGSLESDSLMSSEHSQEKIAEEWGKLKEEKEKMSDVANTIRQLESELSESKIEASDLKNELSKAYTAIECNKAGISDLNEKSHELGQNLEKAESECARQESTIAVLRQNSMEKEQLFGELHSKLNFLVSILSPGQIDKMEKYLHGNLANNAIEYQQVKAIEYRSLDKHQDTSAVSLTGLPLTGEEAVVFEEINGQEKFMEFEKQLEELQKRLGEKDVIVSELQKSNSSLLGLVEKGGGGEKKAADQASFYKLEAELQSLRMEREQMVAVVSEKSRENSNLKQETQRLMEMISTTQSAMAKLQQDKANLEHEKMQNSPPRDAEDDDMRREALANMARLVRDRETEMEALKQKNETLLAVLQETKESEAAAHLGPLLQEKETLTAQMRVLTSEREQLIACITQKHSESLAYHSEAQRFSALLGEAQEVTEKVKSEYASLIPAFEDKSQALVATQTELVECKRKLTELEISFGELVQRSNTQNTSLMMTSNSKDLEAEKEKHRLLENELKSTITERENKVESLTQKVNALEEMVSGKEGECMHIRKQLDNSKFQLTSLMSEIADVKVEKEQIQQRHSSQDEESSNFRDQMNQQTLAVKDKELQIMSLKEQITSLNSLLRDKEGEQSQVSQLMREKEVAMASTRQLQQDGELSAMQAQQRLQECNYLKSQIGEMREKEQRLGREVERLRSHLIEMEEGYTTEALESEEREKELRNRLALAEEHLMSSSSQVHLASQESVRQIEVLQDQLKQTAGQRDSAYIQITNLQEQCQQYSSSLSNLQLVLEHFQKEKDSAITIETEKFQNEAKNLQATVAKLQSELQATRADLLEALDGLDAASRISEQLDRKEDALAALKEEVQLREQTLKTAEDEIHNLRSNTEAKVDKTLMHNIVMTWLTSPEKKRDEIVQLIGHVLDFSVDDFNKIESAQSQGGLLIGFFKKTGKLASQAASQAGSSQSFSQLFVKFLETESSPPPTPVRLPAEAMAAEMQHKHKAAFNPFMAPRHVTHDGAGPHHTASHTSSHILMRQDGLGPSPLFAPMNTSSGPGESAILKDVLNSQR